jgi:hypothetical protein
VGRLGCLIIGLIVIVAIGLVLGLGLPKWLGGGVDLSSPIAAVDSFLEATEDQNSGRMADCCDFPMTWYTIPLENRTVFIDFWDFIFEEYDSIKITNIHKQLTNETEDEATVHATYNVTADGDAWDTDEYYDLVKIDGKWYIIVVHEPY